MLREMRLVWLNHRGFGVEGLNPVAYLRGADGEVRSWEELVNVYLDTLQDPLAQADPQVQRHLLLKVARIYEFELRDVQRAEEAHLRVLQIDAKDAEALASLDRIYDQLSMWPELADILRRRIEIITDTEEIIALYFRLGRVYTDALDDAERAIQCYKAILENDSRNAGALEALERVYFRRESWPELFEVYEKMVDIAIGDEGMADCYARMARIASDALNDREKAIELWGKVVDLRGEDPMALGALAGLYESAELWRELVDILERQVRITEIPDDRIPLYRRLGQIWGEKLERERNSLEAWQEVLQIDPRDMGALRAIAAIYRQMQSWEDLVDTLVRLIDAGSLSNMEPEEIKESYAELGALYGEHLLRPQDAIDAWNKVLSHDGKDFRAMAALENLFTQEARWEECVEILEKRAKVLPGTPEKIAELLKAAAIWEDKVVDPAAAADTYERVLQLEKTNMTASLQLEQIYRNAGNWSPLTDLLLARVDFTNEAQQRIAQVRRREDAQPRRATGAAAVRHRHQGRAPRRRPHHRLAEGREALARTAARAAGQAVPVRAQDPQRHRRRLAGGGADDLPHGRSRWHAGGGVRAGAQHHPAAGPQHRRAGP